MSFFLFFLKFKFSRLLFDTHVFNVYQRSNFDTGIVILKKKIYFKVFIFITEIFYFQTFSVGLTAFQRGILFTLNVKKTPLYSQIEDTIIQTLVSKLNQYITLKKGSCYTVFSKLNLNKKASNVCWHFFNKSIIINNSVSIVSLA